MSNGNSPSNNQGSDDLDTGTGGFPVGVNRARVTYDVEGDGDHDDDESINRVVWHQGRIAIDDKKKDISKSTKSTLAAYLSDTTLGKTPSSPNGSKKNRYSINHDDGLDPHNLSLTDTDGYSSKPDTTLGQYAEDNKYVQNNNLPSMESRSPASARLKVTRGRQKPEDRHDVDGHTLLKNFTNDGKTSNLNTPMFVDIGNNLNPPASNIVDLESPISKYYGKPGVSNSVIFNRFNPEPNQQYEEINNGTADALNRGQFSSKYTMGTSNSIRDLSFGKLAQIGNALSTRSGLEAESYRPLPYGLGPSIDLTGDPSGPIASAAALLPGIAQLGAARIERERLTAKSVLNELIGESIEDNVLINPLEKSWGTLNNVLDEYSGMSNIGMQLLAAALVASLAGIFGILKIIFQLTKPTTESLSTIDDESLRRPYGAYKYDKNGSSNQNSITGLIDAIRSGRFNFWRMIGINATSHSLDRCLAVGALSFFGINSTNASLSTMGGPALTAVDTVTQSPGYYAVMARSVNRSFLLIGDAFMSLGKAFGSLNFVSGIKQIFGLIETLRNSKFMKTVDIFATLGDRCIAISKSDDSLVYDKTSVGAGLRHLSDIDHAGNRAAGKSRLTGLGPTIELAWAAYRAKDLFIMPSGVVTALNESNSSMQIPSFFGPQIRSLLQYNSAATEKDASRISTKDREDIEEYLEGEYVPFYIHDVRTNEILSFHAFLSSLTDDYTASYDTVEAFGRAEPVKVYKQTSRKLAFSFFVVATSKDDFDAMWFKVNKLITMIYPQFTEGRTLVGDDFQIYAPFSQAIGAAPLVRVRIGDLIQSNYSKFNLSRIFGYTYEGTKFPKSEPEPTVAAAEDVKSAAIFKDPILSNIYKPGFTFKINEALQQFVKLKILGVGLTPVPEEPLHDDQTLPEGYVLSVIKVDSVTNKVECNIIEAKGLDVIEGFPEPRYKEYYGNGGAYGLLAKTYVFKASQLIPTESTRDAIRINLKRVNGNNNTSVNQKINTVENDAIKEANAADAKTLEASNLTNFMKDDPANPSQGNAVARSFRSSGGRGLAGFIESINFNWFDNVTWTTDEGEGRKAPKMCKVNITFAPIHDITPGLDHKGFNRAPVYPVGSMSPGR